MFSLSSEKFMKSYPEYYSVILITDRQTDRQANLDEYITSSLAKVD